MINSLSQSPLLFLSLSISRVGLIHVCRRKTTRNKEDIIAKLGKISDATVTIPCNDKFEVTILDINNELFLIKRVYACNVYVPKPLCIRNF